MKRKITAAIIVTVLVLSLGLALASCDKPGDKGDGVRVVMPDGTPALSMAKLFSEHTTVSGRQMSYNIIAAGMLMNEMVNGTADVVIMPTNKGVDAIVDKGADFKLVSLNVLGSLYIVGPDADGEITMDDLKGKTVGSIGESAVPDLVFKHIVSRTEGAAWSDFSVNYYSEAPQVKVALVKGEIDYALVGEPAATAFSAGQTGYGRMNLQSYWKRVTGEDNFPQASMFVKTSLTADSSFMTELLEAIAANPDWVSRHKDTMTEYLKSYGSTSAFPPAAIERCAVTMLRASENAGAVTEFMSMATGSEWNRSDILY